MLKPFIKKMIGKSYSCNAIKLLKKESEEDLEGKGEYFCSELVAKAYKLLGLIDPSKSSNSYWPVDFTDRGGFL